MIVDVNPAEHDQESEDENYFVSMTDMMVGILFIFIILLMVFALNFRDRTDEQEDKIQIAEDVAERIEELRKEVSLEIARLDDAEQARRAMLRDIEQRLKERGLNVEIDLQNGVLRLTEDAVRFAVNRSELSVSAEHNVNGIAEVLTEVLPFYATCDAAVGISCSSSEKARVETVFVEGHTDTDGSDDRNWQLSTERAVNTYRQMITSSPKLRALQNSDGNELVSVSAYAFTRPIAPNDDGAGKAQNRRIDLRFVMETGDRRRLSEVVVLLDEMEEQVGRLLRPNALPDGQ